MEIAKNGSEVACKCTFTGDELVTNITISEPQCEIDIITKMWSSVIICANVNYFSDLVSSFEIQIVSKTLLIYMFEIFWSDLHPKGFNRTSAICMRDEFLSSGYPTLLQVNIQCFTQCMVIILYIVFNKIWSYFSMKWLKTKHEYTPCVNLFLHSFSFLTFSLVQSICQN